MQSQAIARVLELSHSIFFVIADTLDDPSLLTFELGEALFPLFPTTCNISREWHVVDMLERGLIKTANATHGDWFWDMGGTAYFHMIKGSGFLHELGTRQRMNAQHVNNTNFVRHGG
jgi:hypothetical protein